MLETSIHARCPVCLEAYSNVIAQTNIVGIVFCSHGASVVAGAILSATLGAFAANTWYVFCCDDHIRRPLVEFAVCFSAILITFASLGLSYYVVCSVARVGVVPLVQSLVLRRRNVSVVHPV